jgi:hypothetical protein
MPNEHIGGYGGDPVSTLDPASWQMYSIGEKLGQV